MASPPPPHDPEPGATCVPPALPEGTLSRDAPSARVGESRVKPRHYLWIVGAALALFAALRWLGPVLTPFLVGAILAYLGRPIVRRCEGWGIHRTPGTLLACAVMLAAALGIAFVVIPLVQAEVTILARMLPDLAERFSTHVAPWLRENFGLEIALDLSTLRQVIVDNLESARELGLRLLSGVRSGGAVVLALLVNLALIPVVMFYLLRDWPSLVARVDDLVPRRWLPQARGMATEIDHVLAEFLHGQGIVMLSLAAYYAIALSIAGLQFAVPIGLLTGLLVFIPYVGFGIGFTLGVLAALLQWSGWPGFVAVLVVYGIGQLIENYVLLPYVVGDRIGLHPLAVIFALLAFGQLFGFAGVLLALPVSAAMLVALRRVRAAYVDSPLYRE